MTKSELVNGETTVDVSVITVSGWWVSWSTIFVTAVVKGNVDTVVSKF